MPDALSMPRIAVPPGAHRRLPRDGAVSAQFPIRAGKEPRFFSSYPARRA